MNVTSTTPNQLSTLRASLRGRLITPEDSDYDQARTLFMGGFDRRPAAIARPADAADVARAIFFARDSEWPLAVRSGGHSGAGHSCAEGGLVIDLHDMKAAIIDVGAATAWAETGMTAAEYSTAVGAFGLATGFGDTGSVGIGGITLAGGIGYLTRKHGMTIDSVLGAQIVTAQGDILQVNDASHPDLFWAIRGGGGNFGVVTRFQYRLHPVKQVLGGLLMLPATPDVIVRLMEAADAAPEALTAIVNVMPAPPMPFVPAEHHGSLVAMILLCYAGDPDDGARAVAPFKAAATPIVDMIRPMTYPEIFPPEDGSYHPTAVGRTMFVDRIDRASAETIMDFLSRSDATMRVAQLRALGGAMARVPSDATAFAHRQQRVLVNVAAFYNGSDDRPRRDAWTAEFAATLDQGQKGMYVAFVNDDREPQVRAAYPDSTWTRLAAIKARYDPSNVFKLNHNIRPGGA
jgi:FAD/FMN-containing dehydrogenase